jgi:hypothetical protein
MPMRAILYTTDLKTYWGLVGSIVEEQSLIGWFNIIFGFYNSLLPVDENFQIEKYNTCDRKFPCYFNSSRINVI